MQLLFWLVLGIVLAIEGYALATAGPGVKKLITGQEWMKLLKAYPQVVALLFVILCPLFSFNLALALLGIILLIQAANVLIEGAQVVAAKANIPPIIIGILIVGLGTSAPEFFVNVISALKGTTDIAFGNIVGSNIFNMGLIIGLAGWIAGRISIQKSIITTEMPVLVAATLLVIFQVLDFPPFTAEANQAMLSRQDGLVMLLGISMYLLYMFHSIANVPPNPDVQSQYRERYSKDDIQTWLKPVAQILLGIAGLYVGGNFTVTGATAIALGLGAGTLVVGVIIGVGTSLPELAAAITSVVKDELDLVIGNVVGSNIFNILLILGATSVIKPIELGAGIGVHLGFLFLVTLVFFIALGTKRELSRIEAMVLTGLGVGYLAYSLITG